MEQKNNKKKIQFILLKFLNATLLFFLRPGLSMTPFIAALKGKGGCLKSKQTIIIFILLGFIMHS